MSEWTTRASADETTLRQWWQRWPHAGVGLAMGAESGVWALDVDGDDGLMELGRLVAQYGALPATPQWQTGSGGHQYLWRWPTDGSVITSAARIGSHALDTRGRGGQSVMPPSVSGRGPYHWIVSPDDAEPAPAPAWLLDWLRRHGRVEGGSSQAAEAPLPLWEATATEAREWTIEERAVAYMAVCPPAISGQRGHDQLFRVARAVVYGLDLGPEVGHQLISDHYSPRCLPPWSDREIRHKCEQAHTVEYRRPRGYLLQRDRESASGRATAQSPASASSTSSPPTPGEPQLGWQIILAYYRDHYQPMYRDGTAVHSASLGRMVEAREATYAPTPALIDLLAGGADAPRDTERGTVRLSALPRYYTTWARVAWAELLGQLPEQEDVDEIASSAEDRYRARITQLLATHVSLGETHGEGQDAVTRVERRPLVRWASIFARSGERAGRWGDVRGYALWSRRDPAPDAPLELAIHHLLCGQIPGYADLAAMPAKRFARLAALYGVGRSDDTTRVYGRRVIRLSDDYVASLRLIADQASGEAVQTEGDASEEQASARVAW